MEDAGKDAAAIKLATGWERGGDGKWRYEIPDIDRETVVKGLREPIKAHRTAVDDMEVVSRSENRVKLESKTQQATVRLTWDEQKKNWLLTAFEKKNSALDNTTDTGETSNEGRRNDTATPQNTVSKGKNTQSSGNNKTKEKYADTDAAA